MSASNQHWISDWQGVPVAEIEPGARAVVTGASGWLGQTTLEVLQSAGIPTHAYASSSRGRFRALRDMSSPPEGEGPLLLFHYAYLTRDKIDEVGLQMYVARNIAITSLVHDWILRFSPTAMMLASSGPAGSGNALEEDPYGALKRLDESVFSAACGKVDATLRIVRIFSIAGRHMTTPNAYALGSLILDAIRGRDLQVRTSGQVVRTYVAARDVVVLSLLSMLDRSLPREYVFETGGSRVEIGELAVAVKDALGKSELAVVRPTGGDHERNDVYLGDDRRFHELMDKYGLSPVPLEEQIRDTAAGLRHDV